MNRMNGTLTLILGGCRSGKSAFALRYAHTRARAGVSGSGGGGGCSFIATAPVLDEEMRLRIARHREERRALGWDTVEEQTDLLRAIASVPPENVILIDCLTLWVNNIIHYGDLAGIHPDEDDIAALTNRFLLAALSRAGETVMVANEVGLGIVPENALARRFRDLAGRVNQTVAANADVVYFMTAGIPAKIKG